MLKGTIAVNEELIRVLKSAFPTGTWSPEEATLPNQILKAHGTSQ